ncbi:MAG TPA: glutamate racemase [Actinomycetota bacterium]|nr:glutamate racemase [Actinomycetota bacterium]
MVDARRPIGMFDSGVGGLTVARAVIDLLPHEDLVYFGDTARCPYGPRPPDEVRKFALEIMDGLVDDGVKMLVVACNSAASTALDDARDRYDIPVVGVIEPGVRAAVAATRNGRIGLVGTVATVRSGAYDRALRATGADVHMVSQACPRFVEFVERGDTTSDELVAIAHEYLDPLAAAGVDTLILGCTHYPLLAGVVQYVMGDGVVLVSSAGATAADVYAALRDRDMLNPGRDLGVHRFISSSDPATFSELGVRFLGPEFVRVESRPWDRP